MRLAFVGMRQRRPWVHVGVTCFALLVACGTGVDLGGPFPDASVETSRAEASTCSTFAGPTTDAPCSACSEGSKGCQPNGCYGGYFCDISEYDCKTPGTPCSTADKFDAH